MNYQNNENDLDKQLACSSCGLTMGESRLLRDLKRGEITLARRAEPSVTEAWLYICKKPGESRTYASVDENDTHHWPLDQWKSVEKIPLVRAALASPAVSQSTSKEADDYKLIAHLIGIIFFAGDFKAETANERQLEALLIKTGHRYRSWAEIDALVSVTQQAVSQQDGAAEFELRNLRALYRTLVDGKHAATYRDIDAYRQHLLSAFDAAATTASAADPAKCGCNVCFAAANAGGPFAVAARNRTLTDEEVAALDINPWAATAASASDERDATLEEAAQICDRAAADAYAPGAAELAAERIRALKGRASAPSRDAILEAAVQSVSEHAGDAEKVSVASVYDAIRALKTDRHALPTPTLSQQGAPQAPKIKTWKERAIELGEKALDPKIAYGLLQAEIDDLRAALARAPLPAQGGALDLHDAIMRLPDNGGDYEGRERTVYKIGHRDARHAAAELSLAAPSQAGDARDAAYFRWLNEDHADAETREKARELAGRLGTSSYSAITRDIAAAMSASQDKKPESK